jgi:hypothetical protein
MAAPSFFHASVTAVKSAGEPSWDRFGEFVEMDVLTDGLRAIPDNSEQLRYTCRSTLQSITQMALA